MSSFSVKTLWVGESLKPIHAECLKSFLRFDAEVQLFSYSQVSNLPPGVIVKDASKILPKESVFCYQRGPGKGSPSAFSNVFRYAVLYEEGGIWVDTDVLCLKPFLFKMPYLFVSETLTTEKERNITSCVIQSPEKSPIMKYCLDQSLLADKANLKWGEIGPQLLDQAVKKFNLLQFVRPSWEFCALSWNEPELLDDAENDWDPPEQAVALHLNHEILRRQAKDFNPQLLSSLRKWTA